MSSLIGIGSHSKHPEGFAETPEPRSWQYSCDLSPLHVDPIVLPYVPSKHPSESYTQWHEAFERSESDKLGLIAGWANETIRQIPGGVDLARDVDGGGFTMDVVTPSLFTQWVVLPDGTRVRFAQARTAMHNSMTEVKGFRVGGALRSPVMAGIVLEATSKPDSLDPRDAVSLAIFQFTQEEDARYPWIDPRPGRLFDLTPFTETPFFVGPLYGGHPNEVTNPDVIQKAMEAAVLTLHLTVESHLANSQSQAT